jgi:hypothetical protein
MTQPVPSLDCLWCGKPVTAYPPLEPGWLIHIECYEQWERANRKNKAQAQAILQAEADRRQTADLNLQAGAISARGDQDAMKIQMTTNETIPVGEYLATIVSCETADGQFGPQLKFEFALKGGEYEGKQQPYWTSQSFNPKSKLFALARAANGGRDFPAGYTLDTDVLIGKTVTLVIIKKPSSDGLSEFNKVDSVLPVKARTAPAGVKPAPRPAPVADPEPDELPPTDWDKVMAEPS